MKLLMNVIITIIAQCKRELDLPSPHHTNSSRASFILSTVPNDLCVSPSEQTIIPKRMGIHLSVYLQYLLDNLYFLHKMSVILPMCSVYQWEGRCQSSETWWQIVIRGCAISTMLVRILALGSLSCYVRNPSTQSYPAEAPRKCSRELSHLDPALRPPCQAADM